MNASTVDTNNSATSSRAAQQLRTTMAALRLSFNWLGVRKTLSAEQKAQAADSFGAAGDFLSAGKKLIDVRHPRYRAVTAVRNRAVSYFKALSLPYPEPGIRLIRQSDVQLVDVQLTSFQEELSEAVGQLDAHFDELKDRARQRLGSLFDEADYPGSLIDLFGMSWEHVAVEPPEYLRQLSPALYQQEAARVAARFDKAVQLAEQAFVEELSGLVSHLTERLAGSDDGKAKTFRDSTVENLSEFFDRFRRLNVRSNDQLDALVESAQRIVRGLEPQQLRDNQQLRRDVATQLSGVQSMLDGLLVDRPRRRIIRSAK